MSNPHSIWHIDGDSALKRRVRIEIIGKTFALYEQQWRSEVYYFGDLVYHGKKGESHVFGIDDGIKERPKWQIGFRGDLPRELSESLPEYRPPLISNVGMIIIAAICLAIVYMVGT
ncbi:hypothetical protein [Parasphingorhabdus sp.]|uniref:hypothetical protein n=1 Tax=Parasphingorhabdus sp. TaxID=2709688 RepID=UPI003266C5F2